MGSAAVIHLAPVSAWMMREAAATEPAEENVP